MHNGEYVRNQENVIKINEYINDYANIVDDETEKKGEKLQRTDGTQIVFITVDSLEGKDIREVAFDTFNFYHLGDEDKDNGVLFITEAKGNHDYYMEVGTGLEGSLTDIRSSHLQKE
nr:TPM domain-containing protein [Holdemanella porci]